jgi:cytochrome c553
LNAAIREVPMAVRFPVAFGVPVVVLGLLAVDAHPVLHAQDPPTSPAPPVNPAGQPASTVRPRMREHYLKGVAIRDAVIRADLAGVREPATWLAEHAQEDLPASAASQVQAMRVIADQVVKSTDLAQASSNLAQLAASCGACHETVNVTPTLLAAMPKGEDETLKGQMRKHHRAADLLYRGLIVPSDYSWNRGADALSGDPMELALKLKKGPQPEIEALAKQLYDQAQQAKKATTAPARAQVYGQMLVTCASCHTLQKVRIPPGLPPA